jgi:hypothetical protein
MSIVLTSAWVLVWVLIGAGMGAGSVARLKAPILRYFKGCTEGLELIGDNIEWQ